MKNLFIILLLAISISSMAQFNKHFKNKTPPY